MKINAAGNPSVYVKKFTCENITLYNTRDLTKIDNKVMESPPIVLSGKKCIREKYTGWVFIFLCQALHFCCKNTLVYVCLLWCDLVVAFRLPLAIATF